LSKAKANLAGLPPLKVAGSYTWGDEHTLQLVLRYIESPHTETMICHFNENIISLEIHNSFDFGTKIMEVKGVLSK
jgi:hypothetical protein